MPALFIFAHLDLWIRWLACQRIMFLTLCVNVLGTALFYALANLFMTTFDYGISGVPIADAIVSVLILTLVATFSFCSPKVKKVLQPLNSEAFEGWFKYLKIGIPTSMMLVTQSLTFYALVMMAASIGELELGSFVICLHVVHIMSMFSKGMAMAASALIGNSIGANNVKLAKRFFSFSLKFSMILVGVIATAIIIARRVILRNLTPDEEVIDITTPLVIIASCNFLTDGLQGALGGSIRALGLQKYAGYIALGCYLLIGLPLSVLLAFKCDLGLKGLLFGMIAATTLQALLYLAILLRADWQEIAYKVAKRISKEQT